MADAVVDAGAKPRPAKTLIKRHGLIVRLCHWINVLALFFMLVSGLQIFNAHPALYWGKASTFASPWLAMTAQGERGVTTIGDLKLDTTGVLGRSKSSTGIWEARGFPTWLTLPSYRSLAEGRNWHLFFAWVFGVNGLIYLAVGLINRHLLRDVLPSPKDLATLHKDPHLRLKFAKDASSTRYHQMQRVAYSGMVFVVLPVIVLTGLCMSPGLNAALPWLVDLFGGRQSARSIHFIAMVMILAFVFVHLLAVLLSDPFNQLRGMITGRFAVEQETPR